MTPPATPKALLFDFGGTLDAEGVHWLDRFLPLYRHASGAADEAITRAFYRSDDELSSRFDLAGLDLEATLRRQVGCVLERLAPGRPELAEPVVAAFVAESRAGLRRSRSLLERLARSFSLGVVSNFYGNLDGILRAEGLADLFGVVADSGRVGTQKPAAAIFLHATGRLGVRPEEALMVGDSLDRDMRGAEALGMPHAWLSPVRAASCCPNGIRINRLEELEERLTAERSTV